MIASVITSLFLVVNAAAAPAPKGYVVKVAGSQVYLDYGSADGAAPGRGFQVYSEGESIKHPITGEELGKAESVLGEGKIESVMEKMSIGAFPAPLPQVTVGARARMLAFTPPPPPPAYNPNVVVPSYIPPTGSPQPVQSLRPGEPALHGPRTRGAALPYVATGLVVGDFDGAGRKQVAIAEATAFYLYAYPAAEHKPLATARMTATGVKIMSVEAADLDGDKKDELFVSVHNEQFRRLETYVYKLDGAQWTRTAELPFLVHAHQDAKGARVIATQQIQDDKTFPFGAVYPLVWRDGKYQQGRPAVNPKRADWLYGFTYAQVDSAGEPAALYLTSVNSLRVQFANGHWRSNEGYGQSPNRVRWYDKMLEFNPPMLSTYSDKGFQNLYIVRNLAMLGGLANPFGLFNGGELHAKSWTGVAFETAWKADLGGSSPGFAIVEAEPGRKELLVAVAGSTGKSAVWTFDP